jgi:uncharacterized protein with HEPN domain
MKKDDAVYLRHILDAIEQIKTYLEGIPEDEFLQTRLVQDAVVRQLEIIGEATRNLSTEFRKKYSEVPWSQIIGLRNRIAHDYLNVDIQIVWEITFYSNHFF